MSVEVKLDGVVAARVGTSRLYLSVPEESTLSDVVERLADRYGPAARGALLDEGRLRSEAAVTRRANVTEERLSLESRVEPGDRLRVESR